MMRLHRAIAGRFGLLVVLTSFVLVVASGCGHAPNESKQEIDAAPYLGTWECVGVRSGDGTQSLDDYVSSTGKAYGATMVVRENGFAYLLEEEGGTANSEVIPWLRQDYKVMGDEEKHWEEPVGPLYSADYLELDDGQMLKPFADGKKLVFSKVSDSLGPLLRPAQLPGCTVDVPIELMDDYLWQINNLGGVESMNGREDVGLGGERVGGRDYTSAHIYVKRSYKGMDDQPEGEEIVANGNTLYLSSETTADSSKRKAVRFILPGQDSHGLDLYEVALYYDEGEAAYYEDYANGFVERVHIGNDAMPDVVAVSDASAASSMEDAGYVDGPISWQDASQHIGEHVEIFGTVASTNYSRESDGEPTFIDIGEAYPSPNRVTAVIWGEDRGNFPDVPESMYAGKYIKVEGELYQHDGVCNIKVSSPSQIVAR